MTAGPELSQRPGRPACPARERRARHHRAEALSPATVCVIDGAAVDEAMARNPELARELLRRAAARGRAGAGHHLPRGHPVQPRPAARLLLELHVRGTATVPADGSWDRAAAVAARPRLDDRRPPRDPVADHRPAGDRGARPVLRAARDGPQPPGAWSAAARPARTDGRGNLIDVKAAGASADLRLLHMHPTIAHYAELRVPRYTSYPPAPRFGAEVDADRYGGWLAALTARTTALSLYLHVPFCKKVCWYCACNMKLAAREDPVRAYGDVLQHEIALVAGRLPGRMAVTSVHWGGGTPTSMPLDALAALMAELRAAFALAAGRRGGVRARSAHLRRRGGTGPGGHGRHPRVPGRAGVRSQGPGRGQSHPALRRGARQRSSGCGRSGSARSIST